MPSHLHPSSPTPDFLVRLHDELMLQQRRMRAMRLKTPSSLDPWSSLILPALARNNGCSTTELAQHLSLDRSNLSRAVQHLASKKYLRVRRSKQDVRRTQIEFTPLGQEKIREAVALNQKLASLGMIPLVQKEREQLAVSFQKMASALGAVVEQPLPGEEFFAIELRRYARVTGMHGSNFAGTGMDVGNYQILFQLFRSGGALPFSALQALVPLDPTTFSRRVTRFVGKQLIKKLSDPNDRRRISLTLSDKGRRSFVELRDRVAEVFGRGVAPLTPAERDHFVSVLSRVNSHISPDEEKGERVVVCNSEKERFRARAFLVESLIAREAHRTLPAEIVLPSELTYLLERDGKVVALLSVESLKSYDQIRWLELSSLDFNQVEHDLGALIQGYQAQERTSSRVKQKSPKSLSVSDEILTRFPRLSSILS